MRTLLLASTLLACATTETPGGSVPGDHPPVVRVISHPYPRFGFGTSGSWGGFPTAIRIYNENAFELWADVRCNYARRDDLPIAARSSETVPITLGDGSCRVEFRRWPRLSGEASRLRGEASR